MRILKLLNKKHLSIVIIFLTSILSLNAEDQPVDIWNIEKKIVVKESEIDSAINLEKEPTTISSESSIYKMQSDKKKRYYRARSEARIKRIKNYWTV